MQVSVTVIDGVGEQIGTLAVEADSIELALDEAQKTIENNRADYLEKGESGTWAVGYLKEFDLDDEEGEDDEEMTDDLDDE